jgi:hypothetical protein
VRRDAGTAELEGGTLDEANANPPGGSAVERLVDWKKTLSRHSGLQLISHLAIIKLLMLFYYWQYDDGSANTIIVLAI